MKADPKVRRNGRCAQCGGVRKTPKARQRGVDPMHYERDPFCSSTCARTWHGVPTRKGPTADGSARLAGPDDPDSRGGDDDPTTAT